VIGHIIDVNPAHAARGRKYVVRKGKTSVLTAEEARELLDSIPLVRNTGRRRKGQAESPKPSVVGLRDRALIAVMVYSFARISAVLEMNVRDYFVQGRRGWVRLHEKGGKEHEVPCHHNLETYLDEYIAAAGIVRDPDGPLFRTAAGKTGELTRNPMWQQDAYWMIQRRAADAGIKTRIGNHTFRATGITAYLKNNGTLEHAQYLANHESPRTTSFMIVGLRRFRWMRWKRFRSKALRRSDKHRCGPDCRSIAASGAAMSRTGLQGAKRNQWNDNESESPVHIIDAGTHIAPVRSRL